MAPLPLLTAQTTISRAPAPVAQQPVGPTRVSAAARNTQANASAAGAALAPAGGHKSQRKLKTGPILPAVVARPDEAPEAPSALPLEPLVSALEEEEQAAAPQVEVAATSACEAAAPAAVAAAEVAVVSASPRCVSAAPSAPPSVAADCQSVASTSWSSRRCRDQNSVTIKDTTVVKDAAGALDKILSRGVTALVTALRPEHGGAYASLNQAVKSIAVARQYVKDKEQDSEVTFLPFNRMDGFDRLDPARFAFLVFRSMGVGEALKTTDRTDLNVSRSSDVNKMANAIISVILDRGQAVMKAAGNDAIFIAMSAVVNARHRLIAKHQFDLMLAAAWITEDTMSTLGRESKFLRFNVLRTEPNGPKSDVPPTLPAVF